jgi:diguanylate cyclase (GGDEF)-like protein
MEQITDIGRQQYANPEDRERYTKILEGEGIIKGFEVQLLAKDGSPVWVSISARAVRNDEGIVVFYEGTLEDITARKQAEENLKYLSIHDPLTGLHNRFLFEEELRRLGTGRFDPIGIVMCDLDGLKLVNDNLGHDIGDRQLIVTANLLKTHCRTSDIVARIGGDEFGILLPHCSGKTITGVYDRLRQGMGNLYIPDTTIPLMVSIGTTGKAEEHPIKELLKEADVNMYAEKNLNRVRFGKRFADIMSQKVST